MNDEKKRAALEAYSLLKNNEIAGSMACWSFLHIHGETIRALLQPSPVDAKGDVNAMRIAHEKRVAQYKACKGEFEASTEEIINWYKQALRNPTPSNRPMPKKMREALDTLKHALSVDFSWPPSPYVIRTLISEVENAYGLGKGTTNE